MPWRSVLTDGTKGMKTKDGFGGTKGEEKGF